MPSLKSCPSDLLAVFNHLHVIVRVLTFIAAFGGGGATIHHMFGNQAKSLFTLCKSLSKEHRNESCTSGTFNQAATSISHDFDSDSDNDNFVSSRAQTHLSHVANTAFLPAFQLFDNEDKDCRPRKQRSPPLKRRRIGNGSKSRTKKDSSRDNGSMDNSICSIGAWACASFMLVLQPSFQSVEFISSHLVWPEDNNNQVGNGTVLKTTDPFGALVCAAKNP